VVEPRFDYLWDFADGLAPVLSGGFNKGGKWGYIDAQGTVVVSPQFDAARPFREGLAAVRVDGRVGGKWGFIYRPGASDKVSDAPAQTRVR
jgi:hypothetical protein